MFFSLVIDCYYVFQQKVQKSEIGDVVILDADTNRVETPFDDLNNLPQEVVSEKVLF